jgi:hypothetical protein
MSEIWIDVAAAEDVSDGKGSRRVAAGREIAPCRLGVLVGHSP